MSDETDETTVRRRKALRDNDDCESGWTSQQLVALILQLIEVAAIVVIAWVALFSSREMDRSQTQIIDALRGLHSEVQRSEAIK